MLIVVEFVLPQILGTQVIALFHLQPQILMVVVFVVLNQDELVKLCIVKILKF